MLKDLLKKLRTYCATVKYKDKINILIYTIKCLLSIKIEK